MPKFARWIQPFVHNDCTRVTTEDRQTTKSVLA